MKGVLYMTLIAYLVFMYLEYKILSPFIAKNNLDKKIYFYLFIQFILFLINWFLFKQIYFLNLFY